MPLTVVGDFSEGYCTIPCGYETIKNSNFLTRIEKISLKDEAFYAANPSRYVQKGFRWEIWLHKALYGRIL